MESRIGNGIFCQSVSNIGRFLAVTVDVAKVQCILVNVVIEVASKLQDVRFLLAQTLQCHSLIYMDMQTMRSLLIEQLRSDRAQVQASVAFYSPALNAVEILKV